MKSDVESITSGRVPAAGSAAIADRAPSGGLIRELASGWLRYVLVMFCLGIFVMGIGSVWQFGIHGEVNGRPLPTGGSYAWGRWLLVALGTILAGMGIAGVVAILRNWLSPDETSNPPAVQNTLAPAAASAATSRRNGHAPPPPAPLPMVLASAIGMVLGGVSITAGIAIAVYALLTQDVELGSFWGWMGGAFGGVVGGIGALAGSWNTYRQLEGAEDLLKSPRWTWLDQALVAYTVLGATSIVVALAFASTAPEVVTYSLLLVGGIVVFQGVPFLVFRGLYRRAAQQDARQD